VAGVVRRGWSKKGGVGGILPKTSKEGFCNMLENRETWWAINCSGPKFREPRCAQIFLQNCFPSRKIKGGERGGGGGFIRPGGGGRTPLGGGKEK
jgi:hypothetical protein